MKRVAALAGNGVDLNPAALGLSGTCRLHRGFGDRRGIHAARLVAAREELVVVHAVTKHDHVGRMAAVDTERLGILAPDAADVAVGGGLRRRRDHRHEGRGIAGEGNRIADLARDHLLGLRRGMDIHHRGFPRHRDRLCE